MYAIFYLSRVALKHFKCRVLHLPTVAFCKRCGRDVHDFSASDDVWDLVEPHIKFGHILCYDCFCEICGRIGLPVVWELARPL